MANLIRVPYGSCHQVSAGNRTGELFCHQYQPKTETSDDLRYNLARADVAQLVEQLIRNQ